MNIKLIKAFRISATRVGVMYVHQGREFIVFWSNENQRYDLEINCLAKNESLSERIEQAIKNGESDDNSDVQIYLQLRDTFDSLDCESV